jgi:adenylate cyclase
VRKHTNNLEAYDYYLRAREYHDRYTKEAHTQERQLLEKALELDPQYAELYVRLGLIATWEWLAQWNRDPQILEQAFALAQKAVALDDSLPQVYQLLSHISRLKKKIDQAVVEAQHAVTLDPNDAEGYAFLAQALNAAGQSEKAREAMEKAMRLNPHYPAWYLTFLGGAYSALGQNEQAIATLKEGVIRNPNYLWCHVLLASIYGRGGREEEARAEAEEILRISPNFSLEGARQIFSHKDPEATERFIDGLRKAGLK